MPKFQVHKYDVLLQESAWNGEPCIVVLPNWLFPRLNARTHKMLNHFMRLCHDRKGREARNFFFHFRVVTTTMNQVNPSLSPLPVCTYRNVLYVCGLCNVCVCYLYVAQEGEDLLWRYEGGGGYKTLYVLRAILALLGCHAVRAVQQPTIK